jgi:hypothetical protein
LFAHSHVNAKLAAFKRSAILVLIGSGLSDSEISRARGCSRSFVHKILSAFKSSDNIFEQTAQLGRAIKLTDELLTTLDTLCSREVRSSSVHLAAILSEPPSQETYSPEFVPLPRHRLGYHFLPPIATFPLTETHPEADLIVDTHHLTAQTDWGKPMSEDIDRTDESRQ